MPDSTTLLNRFLNEFLGRWFAQVTGGPSGTLVSDYTAVGNVTGGEDDLMSFSLPANTLSRNGQSIEIDAVGSAANNANVKTLKLKFGSTSVTVFGTTEGNTGWRVLARVIRLTASTQVLHVQGFIGTNVTVGSYAAPTEDLTGAVTIKLTGQSDASATDDVVQRGLLVRLEN